MSVNDLKNNVQTVFKFKAVDVNYDQDWIKESVCIILFYDMTRAESFSSVVGRTLQEVRRHVHEIWSFFMLVGNKLDLEDARQVETEDAQDCAQNQGFLFNEVSSLQRKKIELVSRMLRTRIS